LKIAGESGIINYEEVAMKKIIKNFFNGAGSITVYPRETKIPASSMQEAWKRVWNNFAIVNTNLNEVIYGQAGKQK
jgi:hypothetical protein